MRTPVRSTSRKVAPRRSAPQNSAPARSPPNSSVMEEVLGGGGSGPLGPVLRHLVVLGVVRTGVVGELELEQPGLAPQPAEVAVVGVEQAELADVGDELGEE